MLYFYNIWRCNGGVMVNTVMKTCNTCHITKPLESGFRRTGKTKSKEHVRYYENRCKQCTAEHYANSPELKLRSKWRHIKSKFKIDEEKWTNIFNKQGGKCAICSTSIDTSAHLDHCHLTNNIRGLLCGHCNKGLGHFKDSADTLVLAAEYLKRHL